MTQQPLDGMDIGAGFQQVRGEAVAQGVDATMTPDLGAVARGVIHALRQGVAYRPRAGPVREQPGARAILVPVIAQGLQQDGG